MLQNLYLSDQSMEVGEALVGTLLDDHSVIILVSCFIYLHENIGFYLNVLFLWTFFRWTVFLWNDISGAESKCLLFKTSVMAWTGPLS